MTPSILAARTHHARLLPYRIPVNTRSVFSGSRPRLYQPLLRLLTKDYSDKLQAIRSIYADEQASLLCSTRLDRADDVRAHGRRMLGAVAGPLF